jgi:hypothetical protein
MEESIRQLALISSVLGGFSFTFLSALLTTGSEKKIKFWLVIMLMIASMGFLLSALGWSLMDFNKGHDLQSHHQMLVRLLILGLLAIISALGMSGWLYDRKTGIATSAIGLLSLFVLFVFILSKYISIT